jgi:hypothetical protein
MVIRHYLALAALLSSAVLGEAYAISSPLSERNREWTAQDFKLSEDAFCRISTINSTLERACWDPDKMLTHFDMKPMELLSEALQATTMFASPCPTNENQFEEIPLQMAVAVVGKVS